MEQNWFVEDMFKFKIFDKVPRPESDEALVLFRSDSRKEFLVITSQTPVLSSEIRAGGYDRIMAIPLYVQEIPVSRKIRDDTNNFDINISIVVSYQIKDIGHVFFHNLYNISEEVSNDLYGMLGKFHKVYSVEDTIEIENMAGKKAREVLAGYPYIHWKIAEVSVQLDERAVQVIQARGDTLVSNTIGQEKVERAQNEQRQREDIEVARYRSEIKIEEERRKWQKEKGNTLKEMQEDFGDGAFLLEDMFEGKKNRFEVYKELRASIKEDLATKIGVLRQLNDMDMITDAIADKASQTLLGLSDKDGTFEEMNGQEQANYSENVVDSSEEY